MYPIIIIAGPTASGKTEVSFLLAKALGGEIVSCDSMLIYKEPRVITSKPAEVMLSEIPHHFVSIVSVEETYSVFDYYLGASEKINQLYQQKVPLVICGGSGLYAKALLDGIFKGVGRDENLRKSLEEKAANYGKSYLFGELEKIDPQTAKKISGNDLKRIIRALEVYYLSGKPLSKKKIEAEGFWGKLPFRIFGLRIKRDILYRRINERVEDMFKAGAVGEVERLLKLNLSMSARQIIGIKEIEKFLHKKAALEEAKGQMKKNTRHFAKRQFTWFNREKRVEWVDIDNLAPKEVVEVILRKVTRNA